MNKKIAEIIGWLSVVLSLGLYFLATFGILPANTIMAQFLNIIGCAGMVYVGSFQKAKQSIAVNVIWGLISFFALIYLIFKHH